MDPSQTPLIILLLVLLVCSAVASASETALFGITHGQRAMVKRSNPRLSRMLESLLARPRELLMQVLMLNMMVNIAYFIVTSILTINATSTMASIIISVSSLAVIILIGEVFAKLFASSATLLFLRFAAPMHMVIRRPISSLLSFLDRWVISPLSRLLAPGSTRNQSKHVSPEQMGTLISLSASDGVIDSGEQELLTSIVSMGQMRVEQVMTPRMDVSWIDLQSTHEEIAELCRSSGLTRLLVFEDGIDSPVLGIVDARKVLEGNPIKSVLSEALFIPEQGKLDGLIEFFRTSGHGQAVCVDEHGGVSGVVTIADVVKELVDGVVHPGDDLANEVEMMSVGRWIVPGRLSIHDWAMMFADQSVIEHAKRVNTLGGLVMVLLDRIPEVGDHTSIGDIKLTVIEMDRRSIERVEVQVLETESQFEEQSGGAS